MALHLLIAVLLFGPSPAPNTSLEAGDLEFQNLRYANALALYDTALTTSDDSASVLWRMARSWICLADTSESDDQLSRYQRAESCAIRAVRADSSSSQAHAWLAAAIGNVAMFEGGATKVKLARAVKREVDRAIALDSTNDVAYSVLGSFHKAIGDVSWFEKQLASIFLGGLPKGGYGESETAFLRAIELAPDVMRNHYELAKVYMRTDRDLQAIGEFTRMQTLPVGMAHDVEIRKSASELILELEN